MSYATQLAAGVRTAQDLVTVRVPQCSNHYASGIITNEILWTTAFGDAAWTKTGGITVTSDSVTSPTGLTGATGGGDTIAFAAVGDYIESSSSATNAQSNSFNASLWVYAAAAGTITLRIVNTIAALETITAQRAVTTGWTRISVSGTFTAAANGKARLRLYRDAGDLASVFAWGAQLTLGVNLYDHALNTVAAIQQPSTCQAADAGNGSRCYYTFDTCQDVAHYNPGVAGWNPDAGLKLFTFCRKDAPLALAGADVMPLVESAVAAAQKIDQEHAVTQSERVHFKFCDHTATWNWNQDKVNQGALTNTATPTGTFWRRFLRLHRNYANPAASVTHKVGFVESGAVETDYQQRGKYLIRNLSMSSGGMLDMECTDRLKLLKLKAPAKISETNLLNGALGSGTTSATFDDGTEITTPGTGYNVCLELEPGTASNEFVNVTAKSGNVCTIQRGRWGTAAVAHADNVPFREVLQFGTENPVPASPPMGIPGKELTKQLLYRAGLATSEVDSTTIDDEWDTWLPGSISGTTESGILFQRCGETVGVANGAIADQSDLESFLKQIREVCMLDLWVNESQMVTGKLFHPARPTEVLETLTETNDVLVGSVQVDDNEESRISRVIIAYDLRADKNGSSLSDYTKFLVRVDADVENAGNYGEARTKTILSPWIKATDSSTASTLAAHILHRFTAPVREIEFSLELRRDGIKCGDYAYLTVQQIVTASGATDSQRMMQMVKKTRVEKRGRLDYVAVDTNLSGRFAFIAPDANEDDYDLATPDERRYAYIAEADGTIPTAGDAGYAIW